MIDLNYLRTGKIKTGKNGPIVKYIDNLYDTTAKMYLKQHKDWYLNDRFVRGDHWIIYNKTINKIQVVPVSQGEVRRTINKIRSQLRGVKNFIKRSQPRWEIHPNDATDEALQEAIGKNKILQNFYRTRRMTAKMTGVIINSLKYSLGVLEGGVIKKNGKEYLDFWVNSTYDVVFDPYAKEIQDCRYIFKTFVKPVESIKNNKEYNVAESEGLADNKEAASEYKNVLELERYSRESNKNNKDLETSVIKECWLKWEEDGEVKIRVITVAGNNVLRVYTPKYRRYPFFGYNPETNGDTLYSDPWIKDLISMNKSLDKTASQIEAYIQRMLAGKYLIKQGVEVSSITDKGAEKIYYKGQTAPKQLELQPLPAAPFTYTHDLERWIEELGGTREASLGRAPGSLQSGKAVEALQSADAQTVAEPIENLELFLQDVGEFILEIISQYDVASKEITEDGKTIKYIGKLPEGEEAPKDAIQITDENEVKVIIVPEIAYSEDSKKEWLMKLAESGIIDEQTVLDKFNISNISEIMERNKKHKEEEFKKEIMKQKESHRSDGNAPTDSAALADQENMQMASGQDVPATPQALWVPEHTQLHMAFIQENRDAYEQQKELFDNHITLEEEYAQ